jgi:two-component system, OmpR family, copper resistance phosphate regulon response regulator CusR
MRILVIEDEAKLRDYLRKGLTESGHVVDTAADGIDGKHMALHGDYDVIVLDIMLPGIDGFGVIKALREAPESDAASHTPVLMLSAKDRIEDRVRGLQDGADDYLVKPFSFTELLARLTALRRRSVRASVCEDTLLAVGDLQLDLTRHKATRAGVSIDLTAKEFTLLALLMRRQGEVLSRTVLAEQVWDINFDSNTNAVDVAVRRLRAKVDDPFEPKMLRTVRGMGYVLEQP